MIQTEKVIIKNKVYLKTFSDKGFYIIDRQSKEMYEVAFSSLRKTYFYDETDKLIP